MSVQAVIVGAAPEPGADCFYRDLLGRFDVIVACDAAAEWCVRLGRVPTYAIGDFDSATPGAPNRLSAQGIEVVTYPRDKDETDLDLAAAHAASHGAASLAFTASFTGRLDHTLAALGTLRRHAELAPTVFEPRFTAWLLSHASRPALDLVAPAGAVFSVIALEPVTGLTVEGARYPAHGLDLDPLSSRAISNESLGAPVRVRLERGMALVMLLHSSDNAL